MKACNLPPSDLRRGQVLPTNSSYMAHIPSLYSIDESNLEISDFKMAGVFWRKPFSKYICATKSTINKEVWLTSAPFSYRQPLHSRTKLLLGRGYRYKRYLLNIDCILKVFVFVLTNEQTICPQMGYESVWEMQASPPTQCVD